VSVQTRFLTDISHRADALTSLVALASIMGSSFGGYTFLDPLGGIAVSFFILQQGLALSKTALWELLDAGIDAKTQRAYETIVADLVDGHDLLDVRNIRGVKSGGGCICLPAPYSYSCQVKPFST
jgi:divalent metal cation (Fe/Co/Zn/Cd) transporter